MGERAKREGKKHIWRIKVSEEVGEGVSYTCPRGRCRTAMALPSSSGSQTEGWKKETTKKKRSVGWSSNSTFAAADGAILSSHMRRAPWVTGVKWEEGGRGEASIDHRALALAAQQL
jgi:hypothetical protein